MDSIKYINANGITYKIGGDGGGSTSSLNYTNGQVMIQADEELGRAPETDSDGTYGHIYAPDGCEVATTANGKLFVKKIYSQEGGSTPMISGEEQAVNFYAPDGRRGLSVSNEGVYLSSDGNHQNVRVTPSGTVKTYGLEIRLQSSGEIKLDAVDKIDIDSKEIALKRNDDPLIHLKNVSSQSECALEVGYLSGSKHTEALRGSGARVNIGYPGNSQSSKIAISAADLTAIGDESSTAKHLVLNSPTGSYENDAQVSNSGMQIVIYDDEIVLQCPNGSAYFKSDGHFYVNGIQLA